MIAAVLASLFVGQATPDTVLPGVLDLPLLEGSRLAPDCLGLKERLEDGGDPFACVGAPVERVNALAFAYVDAAKARGWTDAGGAANALWLTRPLADGRCQKLTVAGMWDFERTTRPRPTDPGFVLISLDADARCPAASRTP